MFKKNLFFFFEIFKPQDLIEGDRHLCEYYTSKKFYEISISK